MLKLVLIGVWVAMVTAASAYFGAGLFGGKSGDPQQHADLGVEQLSSDMTSVPMVRGGEIIGYVIIQVTFAADKAVLAELKLDPKPYLTDAEFRAVYGNTEADFTRLRPADIDVLTTAIASEANARIGGKLVRQVLIQQLNYVRKEDIRTHWINKDG
ncbi:hypothetical protein [Aestuariivirga sp.]|uniref:hypothetical protein n=1 Tax=Aestuariivirga sp. TaxID=2650926 RepID=UPI0039E6D675